MKKFDIHVHSYYSDGINSPAELVSHAKKLGLDGIAITDHNEIEGTLEAMKFQDENFLVIPGLEISSREGHIVALGISELIPEKLSAEETVKRIHELGGIAIAAHPYDLFRGGVGDLVLKINFDAVEVENGHTVHSKKKMLDFAKKNNLPISGGSDAHCLEELGVVTIEIPEKYESPIDAIKNRDLQVVSKMSKIKILKNFVKRRFKDSKKILQSEDE